MEKLPDAWKMLFRNLSVKSNTFALISNRFDVLLMNVERLVNSANLLKDADYMTASFIGTTAREEMAKAHILIDACRLDSSRHKAQLKCLCKAFYSHSHKHAYYAVLNGTSLGDMKEAKRMWDMNVRKWFQSSFESDEPDECHANIYLREMPLYVDYSDYNDCWQYPHLKHGDLIKSARLYPIELAEEDLNLFKRTHNTGLYKEESLSIINKVYVKKYVSEKTETSHINSLYQGLADQIERELEIPQEKLMNGFISKWPLYHFVGQRVKV